MCGMVISTHELLFILSSSYRLRALSLVTIEITCVCYYMIVTKFCIPSTHKRLIIYK